MEIKRKYYFWALILSLNESGDSIPGKPFVETSVKLLNLKCGLNDKVSKKEIPISDAPTTTILRLIATYKEN